MAERVVKVTLSAQVAQYITAMQDAAAATKKAAEEGAKVAEKKAAWDTLGKSMVVVGAAMTGVGVAVAKTGIEYNTLQQKSRAALTTMLGSAKAANEQMDKLDTFARTSPFSKATFISAQQQMLAFGIETKKVIPYLDALQNAVAASGGSNADIAGLVATMSKIKSSAKLTATDLMEFGNRGVDAAGLIGQAMGKTGAQIREEITAGTLDADVALDALAQGMSEKFDGAAANVKNTFEGSMDRVRAAWRDVSADLMKPFVNPNGGGMLVDFMNSIADMMRAFQQLPEPVKLATGATTAAIGAFALVGGTAILAVPKVLEFRNALQALNLSMGKVGLVGGAAALGIGVLVGVIAAVAQAQADAEAKAQAYADALDAGGEAARKLAQNNLQVSKTLLGIDFGNAYDNAEKLGIGLDLVTDAALGNEAAMKKVNAVLDVATGGGSGAQAMADDLGISLLDLSQSAGVLREQVQAEADAQDRATKLRQQATGATDETTSSTQDAAAAYRDAADEAKKLNDEVMSLVDSINRANGIGQDAVSTNARWQEGLAGLTAQVQEQRDAYEEANGTTEGFVASLDQATAAGSANASMLAGLAGDAQAAAQAQYEVDRTTMSAKDAADKYAATLADQRQKFIDSAVQAGYNADEVQKLADKVFALPSSKEIQILSNTGQAQDAINQLIWANDGRRITLNVQTNETRLLTPGGMTASSNYAGGLYSHGVKAFYSGGFASGIYAGVQGGIHKFAESEMGVPWETYISGRAADRERNIGIWQETGRRLGLGDAGGAATPPVVYVQNPFTGEYLLAQVSDVATGAAAGVVRGSFSGRRR